jgi:glutamate racemase
MRDSPIAAFDSGLGGLSVVRHLRELLPREEVVYFGDTARVPYGTKSRRTVKHFALEAARFLLGFEPKLIVAACHTASALALDDLRRELPVPVVGVVEPGARAVAALRPVAVAILGTEATIASRAYEAAIHRLAPSAEVISLACPLFVPMVEEGRCSADAIVRQAAAEYLRPLAERPAQAVVLGCTHYPLLWDAIAERVGPHAVIVDCGRETALAVRAQLREMDALSERAAPASMGCYVSDNPARFRCVGSRFLQHEITHVEFVEPERYISSPLPLA